jgi:hypothetical protein
MTALLPECRPGTRTFRITLYHCYVFACYVFAGPVCRGRHIPSNMLKVLVKAVRSYPDAC